MCRQILVSGSTGNQGGSVAKFLLRYPETYKVRCLTRNPASDQAKVLKEQGAEIIKGDLTDPSTLPAAVKDCWGVFAVTNFYDSEIIDDPFSEEQQGRNLAKAARDAGVQCYIWSTMPSSKEMTNGRFVTRLYDGKHAVDAFIRELGLPSCFLYTGNFYENMILRKHMSYDRARDTIVFTQPVLQPDAQLTMLYVEKDLAAIVKAIFDNWDKKKAELDGKYFQASNARVMPKEIVAAAQKVSGKRAEYAILPTTGVPERDTMFKFYNEVGMHPGITFPDPELLKLGIKFHNVEDYIRERLLPHLGLEAVA